MEAYPLSWPLGYKRKQIGERKNAPFQTSFASARDGTVYQLEKLGAKNIIISTNVPLKKDGMPYAVAFGSLSVTDDTGIAVYFHWNNQQKVICCDTYLTLDDNMQAINKTVEALRGIERWKCSDILNQTFTGFKAIPEVIITENWTTILGVEADATEEQIKSAYRKRSFETHPDRGGNVNEFNKVTNAYNQAMLQFKRKLST